MLDPGEACDYTLTPNCKQDCSTILGCGNGFREVDGGEECDEGPSGNLLDGGCPGCRFAICGDYLIDETLLPDGGPKERCDDGPVGSAQCNPPNAGPVTCFRSICGDNFINRSAGEQCDEGGVDTVACDSDCTLPVCGDGHVNDAGEACDDGDAGVPSCSYGQICHPCNSTCTGRGAIVGPYCGDGTRDDGGGEACDDGNAVDEASCPYGADGGRCTACSANCDRILSLTGPYCGDGNTDRDAGSEVCDDGNSDSCGTCSANCRQIQIGSANGRIVAVDENSINDGEGFILGDGSRSRTFEFDKDGLLPDGGMQIDAGAVRVVVTKNNTAETVAGTIRTAIGTSGLNIQATGLAISKQVNLSNSDPNAGSAGNQPITETVKDSQFVVEGMSGGGGLDCPAGVGCTSNQDCMSLLTCQGDAGFRTCQ